MAPSKADLTPRRPIMTVQVGVTGHRALPEADQAALHDAAAGLFRLIGREIARLHAVDQAGASPLFAPAPAILRCISGLAAGADALLAEAALQEGWMLVAALPFAREEFERDFHDDARPRFRHLLGQAGSVCELDGDRSRGGEPYAHIGRQIVEQSDILLAVWDSLPPRGPGGTGDVVQQALDRSIPVAILPPSGAATLTWSGTGDILALLPSIILPSAAPEGFPHAYYAEPSSRGVWAAAAVRWFEQTMLLGSRRTATPPSDLPSYGNLVAASEHQLLQPFDVADRLARIYAARFRAAGLMRYGLLLPTTAGSFVAAFGPGWAQPLGIALQFGSLLAILIFSVRGGWARDQRRFLAYRALAETLRNARLLLPLAAVAVLPEITVHDDRPADWTAWYTRAVLRQAGLPDGRHDVQALGNAARFVRSSALSEIGFLLDRATRFTTIATRLRRLGTTLSLCGLAFVAVHAALEIAGTPSLTIRWFNELALVLPALAPAFLGLLGFGEYGRLATRYSAVAAELQAQVAALDRASPRRTAILPIARRIADVMLAEAADWQLLIKARTVSAF